MGLKVAVSKIVFKEANVNDTLSELKQQERKYMRSLTAEYVEKNISHRCFLHPQQPTLFDLA